MSTTATFAVTFVIYQTFYIIFSIVEITCGLLTNFYLSVIYDNNIMHTKSLESFLFTSQCLIYIGVVMIIVSLMACSIMIKDKTRTVLMYLLIMLIIIVVEFYVGYCTFKVPNVIKTDYEKQLNVIFENVKSEESSIFKTNYHAISIQLSLHCCGFNKSTYWKDNNKIFMENYCCEQPKQSNQTGNSGYFCDRNNIWQDDCLMKSIDIALRTRFLLCVIIFINAAFKVTGVLCFLFNYEWRKY